MPGRLITSRRGFLAVGAAAVGVLPSRRSALPYPFTLGVASGDPSPDGVVLWTRLAPDPLASDGGMPHQVITAEWELAEDDRMRKVVRRGRRKAHPDSGHSVHVVLSGLLPGREYWYRFRVGKQTSEIGRTKTLPAAGSSPKQLRIAVACCQHFQTGFFTAYQSLALSEPDLVLFLGDYIYEYPATDPGGFYLPERLHVGSPEPTDLAGYRIRYGQYKSDPDLRRAHAAAPFMTIWDDHEVKNDYAALIPQPANVPDFAARRAKAYQAFYEHTPMRWPGGTDFANLRIHQRLRVGDLATFHVLDTRQFRDDQPCDDGTGWGNLKVDDSCAERHDPSRTLLGGPQRDWLLDGLQRSWTRWDLLTQQLMFAPLDQDVDPQRGWWEVDSWDGYTADRTRVLEVIRALDRRNTVVLSGDIHNHLVADLGLEPGAAVLATELVAGAISSSAFDDYNEFIPANPHVRFASDRNGYLLLDLRRDEMEVEVRGMRKLRDDTWVVPESEPYTVARFAVERGQAGAGPA
jgi:alkaline phosphatase D